MAKLTVIAVDFKEHHPVTTDGTQVQAIRAFLEARGLDGLNLNLLITDDAGGQFKVTQAQCAALMAQEAISNPRKKNYEVAAEPIVATPQVAPEPTKEEEPKEEQPTPAKHHKK